MMAVAFEREVTEIAATARPPGLVSPEAVSIAVRSLQSIDERYGPDSDNPLAHHNAAHSLDHCRRGIILTNLLYPYIQPQYRVNIHNLGITTGSTHDSDQDSGPHFNELNSAEYAEAQIRKLSDPNLNNEVYIGRSGGGIMATEVERTERGELIQVNLQKGSPDPHKYISAFVDINGIAMEGPHRMILDATNLCFEIYKEPTLEQLYDFIIGQATFLRQRLNDGRIKSDLAYYFPDDIEAVFAIMYKAFHANIVAAHGLALTLAQRTELKTPIGVALRTVDRSVLGPTISRQLGRLIL